MSISTTLTTSHKEKEFDILEEQFLNDCNIDLIPLPLKSLNGFEYEIREITKYGCNRQIAEYALIKCNIIKELKDSKIKYNEAKSTVKKFLEEEISLYLDNIKDGKNDNNVNNVNNNIDKKKIIEEEGDPYNKKFEEEVDEIMEENEEKIENSENLLKEKENIKNHFMYRYKDLVENKNIIENFGDIQSDYRKKREAVFEAALRLIKKIVNNEEEYKKFYNEYNKMQKDNN